MAKEPGNCNVAGPPPAVPGKAEEGQEMDLRPDRQLTHSQHEMLLYFPLWKAERKSAGVEGLKF